MKAPHWSDNVVEEVKERVGNAAANTAMVTQLMQWMPRCLMTEIQTELNRVGDAATLEAAAFRARMQEAEAREQKLCTASGILSHEEHVRMMQERRSEALLASAQRGRPATHQEELENAQTPQPTSTQAQLHSLRTEPLEAVLCRAPWATCLLEPDTAPKDFIEEMLFQITDDGERDETVVSIGCQTITLREIAAAVQPLVGGGLSTNMHHQHQRRGEDILLQSWLDQLNAHQPLLYFLPIHTMDALCGGEARQVRQVFNEHRALVRTGQCPAQRQYVLLIPLPTQWSIALIDADLTATGKDARIKVHWAMRTRYVRTKVKNTWGARVSAWRALRTLATDDDITVQQRLSPLPSRRGWKEETRPWGQWSNLVYMAARMLLLTQQYATHVFPEATRVCWRPRDTAEAARLWHNAIVELMCTPAAALADTFRRQQRETTAMLNRCAVEWGTRKADWQAGTNAHLAQEVRNGHHDLHNAVIVSDHSLFPDQLNTYVADRDLFTTENHAQGSTGLWSMNVKQRAKGQERHMTFATFNVGAEGLRHKLSLSKNGRSPTE